MRKIDISHRFHANCAWMDLLLTRSLLSVAQHGAITSAARALGVTQPALSRRIQQLEEIVGAPLLLRSRHGIALTEAGRLTVREGQELVERFERLKQQVAAHQRLELGVVRVGGGATAVAFVLPPIIARFKELHPDVHFQVREQGSRDVEADVRAERLELGIATLPLSTDEFEVRAVRDDRIVLVAGKSHPLARYASVSAHRLQGLSLVGFEAGSEIRRLIDAALGDAGVSMPVTMELRSIASILEMVARTDSLAFVSQLGAAHRGPDVRVLELRDLRISRQLALISKLRRPLSPAGAAFAAAIRAEF
jgi:molybdate transport repressor ModE-like protein